MSRTAWSKACENPIAAINFALDELNDDWDRYLFLKDWREGSVEDWPEFFLSVNPLQVAA